MAKLPETAEFVVVGVDVVATVLAAAAAAAAAANPGAILVLLRDLAVAGSLAWRRLLHQTQLPWRHHLRHHQHPLWRKKRQTNNRMFHWKD